MKNFVAGVPGKDTTLPDVSLILGGVEYKLCFDFNAIALVEKQIGVDLMASMIACPSAEKLRALLWASLVRGCPEVTLDQVGTMVDGKNIRIIWEALQMAWFGSNDIGQESKESGEARAQTPQSGWASWISGLVRGLISIFRMRSFSRSRQGSSGV